MRDKTPVADIEHNRAARRAVNPIEQGRGVTEHVLPPERFLRLPQVVALTGLSVSTIYAMMSDKDTAFPQNIKLSGRLVVWSEGEIRAWQALKLASRDAVADRPASKLRRTRRSKA